MASVSSADPDELERYVRSMIPADQALNDGLASAAAVHARWNATPNDFGGRVDGAVLADLDAAVNELTYLDLWVGRVAAAFRAADIVYDAGRRPLVVTVSDAHLSAAGSPRLATALADGVFGELVTIVRPGTDGAARVVRINMDRPPQGMRLLEWQIVLEASGLTAAGGPLHFVIHGWGTSTVAATGAGEQAADLYDRRGVEGATVVVLDWNAQHGADGLWLWQVPGDFQAAEGQARLTGDALGPVFTALAASHPDARVAITAHSLGNHVAMRALSAMRDPTGRFAVDYTAIQPAVPDDAPTADRRHYGAVLTDRVRSFTLTINNSDDALFWYELNGPEALGDESVDSAEVRSVVEARTDAGVPTIVVDHDSEAGAGHLGLGPGPDQDLVRSLYDSQIDRLGPG